MKTIPYTNTSGRREYVGGTLLEPGATRFVPANRVPGYRAAKLAPPAPPDHSAQVLALLDLPIKQLAEALADPAQGVTDADLDAIEQAEVDGKTRKGALGAIAAERLRRAEGSAQG